MFCNMQPVTKPNNKLLLVNIKLSSQNSAVKLSQRSQMSIMLKVYVYTCMCIH